MAKAVRGKKRTSGEKESWEPFLEAARNWMRPYQLAWVNDRSRFRIANKSRQVGWSTIIALEAVIGAVLFGRDQLLISSSEKTAAEVLDKCYKWVGLLVKSGYKVKFRKNSILELGIDGGGKIVSLAQNPDTVRGFTGDVYLDEAAHHAEDREIYAAAVPIATLGGRISICSTPLGQSGLFFDIWSDEGRYKDFSRHSVDAIRAKAEGMPIDIDLLKSNMDEESFSQEYLCKFVDESTSFYPYALIRQCVGEGSGEGGRVFLGVDVGRKHDATCLYCIRELGGKLYTVSMNVLMGESFERQRESIRDLILSQGVTRGRIDSTGIGMQLSEEIAKEFPFIEPVSFTSENKERMAVTVRRRLEGKSIQIPDDRDLISDIHSIRKTVTQGNRVAFDADRTSRGHSDRFWALALAVDASSEETTPRIFLI